MALGDTYTGNAGAIQSNINSLTDQVTSQIQNAPQVRQQMGEEVLKDSGMDTLGDQRGQLIRDLFNADKEMAAKYSNQTPENPMYIENPMAREAAVNQNQNAIWGALGSLNTTIKTRKDILGDAIDRGMQIYQTGLEAKKYELDHMYKQMDLASQAEQRAADSEYRRQKDEEDSRRWELEYDLKKQSKESVPKEAVDLRADVESADNLVTELENLSKGTSYGRIFGSLARLTNEKLGGYSNITALKAKREQAKAVLVRMLAPGVSMGNTGGIAAANQLAESMLPTEMDSPDDRRVKLANLRSTILSNASYLSRNYNVNAYIPGTAQFAQKGNPIGNVAGTPLPTTQSTAFSPPPLGGSDMGQFEE